MWPFSKYIRKLQPNSNDAERSNLPAHIAIIMDGNGRWASRRGLPRVMGHRAGAKQAKAIVENCNDLGIKHLTLYAFSEENWARPQHEVDALMALLVDFIERETPELIEKHVKLDAIGNVNKLPAHARQTLFDCIEKTAGGTGLSLHLALSYGGRDEILQAVKTIASHVKEGNLALEDITERTMAEHLFTRGIPDPDLMIRTSGEYRTSNFLPWQSVYAELYVTGTPWPDFDRAELEKALADFQKRKRRFGLTQAQIDAKHMGKHN